MLKYIITLSIILYSITSFAQQDSITIKEAKENTFTKDVVYGRKYGLALTMDVYRPQNSNGAAIVFINSGGFLSPYFRNKEENLLGSEWLVRNSNPSFSSVNLGLKFNLDILLKEGFTVFDIVHSSSPAYTLNEIVKDCELAIKFIRFNAEIFQINPEMIGTWGIGEGAYLALYLGSINKNGKENPKNVTECSSKANAVVAFFPTGFDYSAELKKFPFLKFNLPALELKDEVLQALSLKTLISSDDSPSLLIYGDQDNPFVIEPCENISSAFQQV